MEKILLFILSFCFLFSQFSEANEVRVLTWNDCVREALDHHPDLRASLEKTIQAESSRSIAASQRWPQVGADVAASDSSSSHSYSYGISASQILFDARKTFHDVRAAGQELSASQYDYAVTSSDVLLNLRRAFTGLLRAQELISLARDIVRRRQESLEMIRLRYEAGREHKGSLLTAEANLAQAQADVQKSDRELFLAEQRLKIAMGLRDMESFEIEGDLNSQVELSPRPHFESLANQNSFLKALAARKESARHSSKAARQERFPQIFAIGDIGRSDGEWPPGDESWSAGVRVSVPVFQGGALKNSQRRAESVFRQSEAQEMSGRDSVVLSLNQTWSDWQSALDNVLVQKKFLDAAEVRAAISREQYANGLISFDNWIIIENELVSARKSDVNARAEAVLAEAEWTQAQGRTLDDEK